MVYIYVLKLQEGKFYIGKTNNPVFRLENHFSNNGSFWTKKYSPISVLEIIENCDVYDEDKYTIKYMDKYGIDNVRGGSFCEISLNEHNIFTLNQMIKGINNRCYICGNNGHFVKDCNNISVKQRQSTKPIFMNRDKNEDDDDSNNNNVEQDCCYYISNIMFPFFRLFLKNKYEEQATEEELMYLLKNDKV